MRTAPVAGVLLLLALALATGGALFGATVVGAGVALALVVGWARLCWRSPTWALVVVVAVIVFSSHVFALAYTLGVPAELVRLAIGVKDVLAWTLLLSLVVRAVSRGGRAGALLVVAASGALFVAFLVLLPSPAPVAVQIQSVRGALVPVLSLGSVAFLSEDERQRAGRAVVHLVAAAAAYALVELSLPRTFLTGVIGVGRFWTDVKQVPLFIDPTSNLPYNFTVTSGFPRLTGTFGDPLSAGTIMGAVLLLVVAYQRRLRFGTVYLVVISAATLLTFTRAGWLLAAIGLAVLSLRRNGPARTAAWGTGGAVVAALAVAFVEPLRTYLVGVFTGGDGSTLAHQQALSTASGYAFSAFGSGWGTGGTLAKNSFADAVTSESTYIALGAQIGLVGLLLTAALVATLARIALRGFALVGAGVSVLATLAVLGFVSESMLTFNGAFVPFVVAGLVAAAPPTPAAPADDVGVGDDDTRTQVLALPV